MQYETYTRYANIPKRTLLHSICCKGRYFFCNKQTFNKKKRLVQDATNLEGRIS